MKLQSLANKIHKVNPQFKAKFVKLFGRKLRKKSSWTLDYNFLETSIKSNSLKKNDNLYFIKILNSALGKILFTK